MTPIERAIEALERAKKKHRAETERLGVLLFKQTLAEDEREPLEWKHAVSHGKWRALFRFSATLRRIQKSMKGKP